MSESDKQPFKMSDSQKCGNRKVWKKSYSKRVDDSFRSSAKSFDEYFRSADFQESAGWHLRSRHHRPIQRRVLVGADGITKFAGATFQLAERRDS